MVKFQRGLWRVHIFVCIFFNVAYFVQRDVGIVITNFQPLSRRSETTQCVSVIIFRRVENGSTTSYSKFGFGCSKVVRGTSPMLILVITLG